MTRKPHNDIESRLQQALSPVEPPTELEGRVDELEAAVEETGEELEAWERKAINDPRSLVHIIGLFVIGVLIALVAAWYEARRHGRPRAVRRR